MKTTTFFLSFILLVIVVSSCSKDEDVAPSTEVTSRDHNVTGFNQIEIEDAFQVQVEFSSTEESVRVEANDNLHQHITVSKNLNKLTIKVNDDITVDGSATLRVFIVTDHIWGYTGTGAVNIQVLDTVSASDFQINLTGASLFSGTLMGGDVNASLTGASNITLRGVSDKFTLTCTGASVMEGFDFQTDWLHCDLSGASTVSTTVNNKLDVWASGASTVYYKGDGTINTAELTGASTIIKVN